MLLADDDAFSDDERQLRRILLDIALFSRDVVGRPLRSYQTTQVVGPPAPFLLEKEGAQDSNEEKSPRVSRPMGASPDVTTVLYGTAWTADPLLKHVGQQNQRLEAADGIRRNFAYAWP